MGRYIGPYRPKTVCGKKTFILSRFLFKNDLPIGIQVYRAVSKTLKITHNVFKLFNKQLYHLSVTHIKWANQKICGYIYYRCMNATYKDINFVCALQKITMSANLFMSKYITYVHDYKILTKIS